jgi:hypothetical protein
VIFSRSQGRLKPWPSHRNKAVALGAISYYVDNFVTGRISKFTYGVFYGAEFDSSDPEHIRRADKLYVDSLEQVWVPGHFDAMLTRVRHT